MRIGRKVCAITAACAAALMLSACQAPPDMLGIRIESGLFQSRVLFDRSTANGRVQLERTAITGTSYILVDRSPIRLDGYSDLEIHGNIVDVPAKGNAPGYSILLARGKKDDCAKKTFALSFTRKSYSIQELPGCDVEYVFERPQGPAPDAYIVGRAGDEVGIYVSLGLGMVMWMPPQTPSEKTAVPAPTAPREAARPPQDPGSPGRRPPARTVAPREAEPEAPRPTVLPSAGRRRVFEDLPPARAGDFTPDLKKPEYDPTKEKS